MWERSDMVHLHWNCNNYNDDSNTRQERESRESKHPAARGWELAISTNQELVCPVPGGVSGAPLELFGQSWSGLLGEYS